MKEGQKKDSSRPRVNPEDEYWARVGVGQVPEIYIPTPKEEDEVDRLKTPYQKDFYHG